MSGTPRRVPVIGLEIHVQLATASKIFCPCAVDPEAPPNRQICPVCSGAPGAMPALNRRAVVLALRLAAALGCHLPQRSAFDRKHYFYPDLPKGYQITQQRRPLARGGALPFFWEGELQQLGLERLHLEEDAGRSQHRPEAGETLVDLGRAGIPLVELVSAPRLHDPAAAAAAMRALRDVVRALGVSDGNLELGSLRCDANVSLGRGPKDRSAPKVELKNLNSFRFVRRALTHEIQRQRARLQRGAPVRAETRLFNPRTGRSEPLRDKETTSDYRYLPEPDLPELRLSAALLAEATAHLPELPPRRVARYAGELSLGAQAAETLGRDGPLSAYFEGVLAGGVEPRRAASWLLTELLGRLDRAGDAAEAPVSPAQTAELLRLRGEGQLSAPAAKRLWAAMWQSGSPARELAVELALLGSAGAQQLCRWVAEVIQQNPGQVAAYRAGKKALLGYFMGQLMALSGGRADPGQARAALERALTEDP